MTYPDSGGQQWGPHNPQQYPQQPGPYQNQPNWQQGPYQGQPAQPGYHSGPNPTMPYGANQPPQGPGFPGEGFPQPDPYQPGPPKRRRTGLVISAIVAVIAIAGGVVVAVWAFNRGDSVAAGAQNPTEAATNLVSSLGNGDVAGMLSSLAPGEAALARDMLNDTIDELKRLEILKPEADASNVSGVELKTENLRFDDSAAEQVNDHVTITKLVDGKLTINSDASKIPLADEFVSKAMPGGAPTGKETETVDIGEQVQRTGEPVRIATVKSGEAWYPSLFYSVADYALAEEDMEWPKNAIPANGAGSPEEAVQQMATALTNQDLRRTIELLPPDEMAVLHDVGPLLLDTMGRVPSGPNEFKIDKLDTETSEATGGTKVIITSFQGTVQGQQISARQSGDCYEMTSGGQSQRLCGSDIASELQDEDLPPQVAATMEKVFSNLLGQGVGVITTEVDGKHYVSPMRSIGDSFLGVLRSFEPGDVKEILNSLN
ncbi:MAG: flagellar basal body protein FliL [Pseudonocardiaceae bacterium]|nr:flagellar basal body protein FliL [Pseudonocardiaceae bacterium]